MLPGRTRAEILLGHDDVTRLDMIYEFRIEVFQAVLAEFFRIREGQVAGGNYDVGIDVAPIAPGLPLQYHASHQPITSAGCVRCPVTADAAATAGPAR